MKILSVYRPKASIVKTVQYFNETFTIPSWVNYLAMDKDGALFGYQIKPSLHDDKTQFMTNGYHGREAELIATIVYDGDWTKSIVKV